jgi:hypothetical protein
MKYPHRTLAGVFFKMVDGESLPSYEKDEFAEIQDAIKQIYALPDDGRTAVLANLGNQVIGILNRRMLASAKAEKVLFLLRDSRPLH